MEKMETLANPRVEPDVYSMFEAESHLTLTGAKPAPHLGLGKVRVVVVGMGCY